MKAPLNSLGKSLAGAYTADLMRWFTLESTLSENPFSPSYESDIASLAKDWDDLIHIAPTLETNFIPTDLLEGFEEEEPPVASSDTQYENARTPNGAFERVPRRIIDNGNFDLPNSKSWENPTSVPVQESGNDTVSAKRATGIQRGLGRYQKDAQPDSFGEKKLSQSGSDSDSKELGKASSDGEWPLRANFFLDVEEKRLDNRHSDQYPSGLDGMSSKPNKGAPTSARSIWNTPLSNLGDFAGTVTKAVTGREEKFPTTADPGHVVEKSAAPAPENQMSRKQIAADVPPENETSHWKALPAGPTAENQVYTPPFAAVVQNESLPPGRPDMTAENSPFQTSFTPQTALPDADELLDALTERIRREFRRYYP